MRLFKNILSSLLVLVSTCIVYAQETKNVNTNRLWVVTSSQIGTYTISMAGLYTLWYKDYPHSSFHWFNDDKEWLQMDKAGHFYSAYYLNKITHQSYKWCNMNNKQAALYGGGIGFVYIASIEVFDGFSDKWGASYSDLIANSAGIGLYMIQELTWKEQRIIPKFSFHNSNLSTCRPDALGKTFPERLLKDYNGQTYWLSINLSSFIRNDKIPKWLNLSMGYSGNNMLGGLDNELSLCPLYRAEERYRQYYLSLDVDFTKIHTNKKALKILLEAMNTLKVPFPALSFCQNKFKLNPLYF